MAFPKVAFRRPPTAKLKMEVVMLDWRSRDKTLQEETSLQGNYKKTSNEASTTAFFLANMSQSKKLLKEDS